VVIASAGKKSPRLCVQHRPIDVRIEQAKQRVVEVRVVSSPAVRMLEIAARLAISPTVVDGPEPADSQAEL